MRIVIQNDVTIKMNRIIALRSCLCAVRRNFCTAPSGPPSSGPNMSPKYRPTDFQKFILVWTKKYKTKEDIPTFVSPELIERSRSEARIKIANVMMLLTALASLGAIFIGKSAAKRGESVHQMNLDWHKKYEDDYKQKEEAATKA